MDRSRDKLGRYVAVDRPDHPPHVTRTPWGTWRVRVRYRGERYDQSFGKDFDSALRAAARIRAALGITTAAREPAPLEATAASSRFRALDDENSGL